MARYIDAEKLADLICYLKCKDARSYCGAVNTCRIVKEIKAFPTADVLENVHGKWVEKPQAEGLYGCSICGIMRFGKSNFCPNCGADMRERRTDAEIH